MAADDGSVPPNRLTGSNIGEHAAALKKLIPDEIFTQLNRGYDDLASANGLPQYFERLARAHPFAAAWHDLQGSVEAGSIQLSEQAFFLLDMRFALVAAARDPEFGKLLSRLRGDDEYFSAAFEAFVFQMYANELKLPISFVPTGQDKQPDLVSDLRGAGRVYLECKSLLDDVRIEERTWVRIREAIVRKLEKAKKSLEIEIIAHRAIESRDAVCLIDDAVGIIDNQIRDFQIYRDGYFVSKRQLMEDGEFVPLPINFKSDPECSMVYGAEHNSQYASKVWMAKMRAFSSLNQLDRLKALFKKARDQLPSDYPGVVHFQVPYRNAQHFQNALDACRDALAEDLNRRKHICAIVITGRFLDKHRESGSDPIISFHYVIPNYSAEAKLPDGFRLLGSRPVARIMGEDKNEFELTKQGMMRFNFGIYKEMEKQTGRYMVSYVSSDGFRQLNIWQDFFDRSRIEFWHEESGHHILDFDMTDIVPGETNKIAIQWSSEGLAVALNGAMLAKTGV
ncbi:hypothetical protein P9272_18600 [Mesorhizobium sp. WSM4976]|uniref:hypothetical protein n=1 Tax=Mesorhizobium sp. WSM4976 TaxID=3038549 RepID=UPI0024166BB2|nr:hypothetical protein [Mesorhizobium sp. WSM4976]MDG4895584.1 hypothetical protein [Mesorhizobium sp. WSM4976]